MSSPLQFTTLYINCWPWVLTWEAVRMPPMAKPLTEGEQLASRSAAAVSFNPIVVFSQRFLKEWVVDLCISFFWLSAIGFSCQKNQNSSLSKCVCNVWSEKKEGWSRKNTRHKNKASDVSDAGMIVVTLRALFHLMQTDDCMVNVLQTFSLAFVDFGWLASSLVDLFSSSLTFVIVLIRYLLQLQHFLIRQNEISTGRKMNECPCRIDISGFENTNQECIST